MFASPAIAEEPTPTSPPVVVTVESEETSGTVEGSEGEAPTTPSETPSEEPAVDPTVEPTVVDDDGSTRYYSPDCFNEDGTPKDPDSSVSNTNGEESALDDCALLRSGEVTATGMPEIQENSLMEGNSFQLWVPLAALLLGVLVFISAKYGYSRKNLKPVKEDSKDSTKE